MSALLSDIDHLAIRHSFGAACGITALHLVLERFSPETQLSIKRGVIDNWKGMWRETFQRQVAEYTNTLNQVSNSHHLDQPEDYQQAFNVALAEAEKSARVTLRMEDGE